MGERVEISGGEPGAGWTAPSRVVFGPIETNLGVGRELSARHVAFYVRRAAGGAGVIVTEVASVHPDDHPYERAPLASACGPGWAALAHACRPYGTVLLAGLGHAGGQGSTAHTRRPLWGPSAVPDVGTGEIPLVIGPAERAMVVAGFAAGARTVVGAGLAGVEVQAGQHSLLRQYLSGLTNHRTDADGQDRLRLLRDVLVAVRAAVGPDRLLALRLSVDERAPWAGITPAEGTAAAVSLAEHVDLLTVVRGGGPTVAATRPDLHTAPGFNRTLCAGVRAAVDGRTTVVLQGSVVDPDMAQDALDQQLGDLVEMTRAQLAEPDLVALVRAGAPQRIRPATLSNQHSLVRDDRNPLITDELEPRTGYEGVDPDPAGTDPVPGEVLVVGGGPAGCEAARVAAGRGHRVVLVERGDRLGGGLRRAALVPGRSRFALAADWYAGELARLGVTVRLRTAVDTADLTAWLDGADLVADRPGAAFAGPSRSTVGAAPMLADGRVAERTVVLAVGSRPRPVPFPVSPDVPVVPAAEFADAVAARGAVAAALADLAPGPVLVHDPVGDWTGVGLAEGIAAAGRAVVLLTPDPVAGTQLGATGDLVAAAARLARAGVARWTHHRIVAVRSGRAEVEHVWTGARSTLACAVVVDCAARLPALAPVTPAGMVRVGDAVAPRTVAEAVREGRRAALDLAAAGDPRPPRAAPTDPVAVGPVGRSDPAPAPVGRAGPTVPGRSRRPGSGATTSARPSCHPHVRLAGEPPTSLLDTPLPLGALRLRNRLVLPAHLTGFATDGLPTPAHLEHYTARAAGGAALVITEELSVDPGDRAYEKVLRGYDPAVEPGLRAIAAAVHAHGAAVLAQLNHNGGQSSGRYSRRPVHAPSAVPDPMFREVPVALTVAEIAEIADRFAAVATRVIDVGFDGVELQCSQAALLRQFLSPLTNQRTDGYGGPLAHRVRAVLEVVAAVRAAIGPDRVLGVRLAGDEAVPGGTTLPAAVSTAELLVAAGVDLISTTVGVATASLYRVEPSMAVPVGYARPVSAAIRAAVAVPVIGVGRFTDRAAAADALVAGDCDLVGVVRGQLADPEFLAGPARHCVGCNQECVGRVGRNLALSCAVAPSTGAGPGGRAVQALASVGRRRSTARRVLVVGAGPGGLSAAVTAAGTGHRVVLVEQAPRVGGQLTVAAAAPGRGELGLVITDLHAAARRAGVEIRLNTELDAAAVDAEPPDLIVLATGATASRPAWAGDLARVVDVRDVLTGRVHPSGSVLVLDEWGGHAAPSIAELLAARGATVTLDTPGLVAAQELGTTLDAELFARRAHAAGIGLRVERLVIAASPAGAGVEVTVLAHLSGATTLECYDWVVTAAAPHPRDELWSELSECGVPLRRVGDCLAPRRMGEAIRDGRRAVVGALPAFPLTAEVARWRGIEARA